MMATQRVVPSSARLADLRPDHSPYLPLIGANGHRRGKAMDQDSWDRALLELSGPLMQSWRWGEYKRSQGWEVERVCVSTPTGTAMAQLLFNHLGPTSLAYVPQGPVLTGDGPAVF